MSSIDIGINKKDRTKVAESLKHLLADSYTLYLQTHNFHWNVSGPRFRDLHLMFEEHYTELATAVDEIAERIRTLGIAAPGTYKASVGSAECGSCPQNTFSNTSASVQCTACAYGTYRLHSSLSANNCSVCPNSTINSTLPSGCPM